MSHSPVQRHPDTMRDEARRGKTYSVPTNDINGVQIKCNVTDLEISDFVHNGTEVQGQVDTMGKRTGSIFLYSLRGINRRSTEMKGKCPVENRSVVFSTEMDTSVVTEVLSL